MNTIYREKDGFLPELDSAGVSREFREHASEIANALSKLDDVCSRVEYLHGITKDNGDVGFELREAIGKLGVALAACISYADAYQKEANGEEEG